MTTGRARGVGAAHATRSAIVVGAGIVGAATAYELVKAGITTTLIDAEVPGMGCSYGNAGAISPGSVAPLAMPGILSSVLGMLRDPEGPLHIRPSYLPRALPWLLRFLAASRRERVEELAAQLHELHRGAVENHLALAREIGVPELVQRRGHLHLYPDETALAKDAGSWGLRKRFGVSVARLGRAEILELEPTIGTRYTIGMYLPDHAMVVNPHRYVERIVAAFRDRGGNLACGRVERIEAAGAGWQCTTAESTRSASHLVVAAGVASRILLAPLGIRPQLETQRGYHVTFGGVPSPTSRVVVLADRKAFTTPMEDGFRIAGTVEIAGMDAPPSPRRIAVLERFARATFPGLESARTSVWMGHRPCMPDTLPWIGAAPDHAGLWFAFGHGHTGVTDAPVTARRICAGILGSA